MCFHLIPKDGTFKLSRVTYLEKTMLLDDDLSFHGLTCIYRFISKRCLMSCRSPVHSLNCFPQSSLSRDFEEELALAGEGLFLKGEIFFITEKQSQKCGTEKSGVGTLYEAGGLRLLREWTEVVECGALAARP